MIERDGVIISSLVLIVIAMIFFPRIKPICNDCNIILITLDTVRADHLSVYGYYRNTTPNIDNLVKNSIIFNRAITAIPNTLPSHTSILTSEYAFMHGVYDNTYKVNESLLTVQEILKEKNYQTAAVVSGATLKRETGINIGFDFFNDNFAGNRRNGDKTTDVALSWLQNNSNEKFFLWVHYFDAHASYEPPAPYDSIFDNNSNSYTITVTDSGIRKNITLWYNGSSSLSSDWKSIWNLTSKPPTGDEQNISNVKEILNLSDDDFAKFMAFYNHKISLYDGSIAFIDSNVQRIIEYLQNQKMLNKTIIIITADHGEGFDHGEFFVHGKLFEQDLHVPLIVYYPGANQEKVNSTVSLVDISPTILNLLGIQTPKEMIGENLLNVKNNCDCYAFFEKTFAEDKGIENNEWKIFNSTLFNTKNDLNEKSDLFNTRQDITQILSQKIETVIQSYPHGSSAQNSNFDYLTQLGYS